MPKVANWFHIERVYKNALLIAKEEVCNETIVKLAALLDIADSKFNNGDEVVGPETARTFLESEDVDGEIINHVIKIIENISYRVVILKNLCFGGVRYRSGCRPFRRLWSHRNSNV
jgi:HD superfamily phosphodiesterase